LTAIAGDACKLARIAAPANEVLEAAEICLDHFLVDLLGEEKV
jgi:hypothetical protein